MLSEATTLMQWTGMELKDVIHIVVLAASAGSVVVSTRNSVQALTKRVDALAESVEKLTDKANEFSLTTVAVANLKERLMVANDLVNQLGHDVTQVKGQLDILKSSETERLTATIRKADSIYSELNALKSQVGVIQVAGCDICRRLSEMRLGSGA